MRPGRDDCGRLVGRAPTKGAILSIGLSLGIIAAGSAPGKLPTTVMISPAPSPMTETESGVLTLVGVGDSIPAGNNCDGCTPFVELFGQQLAHDRTSRVEVTNLGVGGSTSADLLESLSADGDDAAAVSEADLVTVTIGANDFSPILDDYLECGCSDDWQSAVDPDVDDLRNNLTAILQRLTELRDGHPATVLVTGYWNVFPDGDVALQQYGAGFEADSAALTRRVDTVIEQVTAAHDATYVDLLHAFKGTTENEDPTELLADDGDHPNQAGHQKISVALSAAATAPPPTTR